jgi:hypothetical protein
MQCMVPSQAGYTSGLHCRSQWRAFVEHGQLITPVESSNLRLAGARLAISTVMLVYP